MIRYGNLGNDLESVRSVMQHSKTVLRNLNGLQHSKYHDFIQLLGVKYCSSYNMGFLVWILYVIYVSTKADHYLAGLDIAVYNICVDESRSLCCGRRKENYQIKIEPCQLNHSTTPPIVKNDGDSNNNNSTCFRQFKIHRIAGLQF